MHNDTGSEVSVQGVKVQWSETPDATALRDRTPSAIMHVIWSNQRATWGVQRIMEADLESHGD